MKYIIVAMIVIFILLSMFTGCGKKQTNDTPHTLSEDINDRTLEMPDVRPCPPYLDGEVEISSPEVAAVIAVAKAYLARTTAMQYEDGFMAKSVRWYKMFAYSPEYATSQNIYNTSCSPFVKDVFWQAWGVDITTSEIWTAAQIAKATEYSIWNYAPTKSETDAEKETIKNEFLSTLIPGDIIALCHKGASGHILIYVGNDYAIHATCHAKLGGGSFDQYKKEEKWEVDGSVEYGKVSNFFKKESYYSFFEKEMWSILRPIEYIKNIKITEQAKLRMEYLQDIYVEKISSHPVGITADLGEKITYGFYLRNDRKTQATVEIKDVVPQNTTYVSGAEMIEGENLSWTVTLQPGEEKLVSYIVTVNKDENLRNKSIKSDKATVCGIGLPCTDIFIAKSLTEEDQAKLRNACENLDPDCEDENLELVSCIYEQAGLGALDLDLTELQSTLVTVHQGKYALNSTSKYYDMIVPNLYGGYMITEDDPVKGARTHNLLYSMMVGDVIICEEDGNLRSFLYAGDGQLVNLAVGGGQLFDAQYSRKVKSSAFGYDWFVVLRPAITK